jgi:phage terminase large subunit-like protein
MSAAKDFESSPLALLAALVLEDGRRWGQAADTFQWKDAAAILDLAGVPYRYLTRPRGGSKTTDLAAIAVAVMFTQAPPGSRLYALAADADQGGLLLDSIRGFAARTPILAGALQITADRVTVPSRNVLLKVLPADAPGAWGLRPYFTIVDELAQWPETRRSLKLWEAVNTASLKQGGRLTVMTTAGDPTHFAYSVLEHAREDPLWEVSEVPGPVPWIDKELLEEQRRALPESTFRRLHLNEWTESEDRLASLENFQELVTHEGPLEPQRGVSYVMGLDIGIVNDRTAAVLCHMETDVDTGTRNPRFVVDRKQTWRGSRESPVDLDEVREWILDTCRRYRDVRVVADPHQAFLLTQQLRKEGVPVDHFQFTQGSINRLVVRLLVAIRNHALALPNDPDLLRELARVRVKESSPNLLRLDHDRREHDDLVIALALALDKLHERGSDGPRFRWLGFG